MNRTKKKQRGLRVLWAILLLVSRPCFAEPDYNRLADAIYKAEGGAGTKHPYGILTKYKTTTPREACINTCRNQWARHKKHNCGKDYITCLRDRYAPLNAVNDPTGLNANWKPNVSRFYENSLKHERGL